MEGMALPPGARLVETQPMALPPGARLVTEEPAAQPQTKSFSEHLADYWDQINPVAVARGMASAVNDAPGFVRKWSEGSQKLHDDAVKAYEEGRFADAARHGLGFILNAIPGVGEAVDAAGNKMGAGDIGGGLTDTAALATQLFAYPKIMEYAPAVIESTPRVVGAAAQAAAQPVPVMRGGIKLNLPASVAGAGTGALAGEVIGRPFGLGNIGGQAGAVIGGAYPPIAAALEEIRSILKRPELSVSENAIPAAVDPKASPAPTAPILDDIARAQAGKSFDKLTPTDQQAVRNIAANIDTSGMPKVTVVKTEPPATPAPKIEPKGVPESNAGLPKEAFETAARQYKAEAAANLLHSSGISIDDAAKMNAEQWDMLAKAVAANDPKGWKGPVELKTAKTQAEVIEQLRKLQSKPKMADTTTALKTAKQKAAAQAMAEELLK